MKTNDRTHLLTRTRPVGRHWSEATFTWSAHDRESAAADYPEIGGSLRWAAYASGHQAAIDDPPDQSGW